MIRYNFIKRSLEERRGEILYDINQTEGRMKEYLDELQNVEEALHELKLDKNKYSQKES